MGKVTSAIQELAERVNENDSKIAEFLNEDQVCELLEKHLSEIANTSDAIKNDYLKQSLFNSFTNSSLDFEDKELYFSILKGLSSTEIILLKTLYLSTDPFVDKKYPERTFNIQDPLSNKIITQYQIEKTEYINGNRSLESQLEQTFQKKWPIIQGAYNLLDSKGLTNIRENLNKKTVKELTMKAVETDSPNYLTTLYSNPSTNFLAGNSSTLTRMPIYGEDAKTPYEASKTKLGQQLIDYVTKH